MAKKQSVNTYDFADAVKEAFDEASSLDNAAEEIMNGSNPDYGEALNCHKSAYDKLEQVLSTISIEEQHRMMLCEVRRPLLEALYSHLEYHFNMRSSLMARDQIVTNEAKRKSYIESIREKASELSSLDVNNKLIDRQFSHQEDLLDSLEEKCSHVVEDLPEELASERLKSMKATIEKLKNKNAHCKQLLDGLVTDYMQMQEELHAAKGEQSSRAISADKEADHTTPLGTEEQTFQYNGADDNIQFTPLEMPPEFDIPDDVDLSFNSPLRKSAFGGW